MTNALVNPDDPYSMTVEEFENGIQMMENSFEKNRKLIEKAYLIGYNEPDDSETIPMNNKDFMEIFPPVETESQQTSTDLRKAMCIAYFKGWEDKNMNLLVEDYLLSNFQLAPEHLQTPEFKRKMREIALNALEKEKSNHWKGNFNG